MLKKKILILFFLSSLFSIASAGNRHLRNASEGLGNAPKSFFGQCLYFFKNAPRLFSTFMKINSIAQSLSKEAQTGIINKHVGQMFGDLDDEVAMKVGPKIAKFRSSQSNKHKIIQEIRSYNGFNKFWLDVKEKLGFS